MNYRCAPKSETIKKVITKLLASQFLTAKLFFYCCDFKYNLAKQETDLKKICVNNFLKFSFFVADKLKNGS